MLVQLCKLTFGILVQALFKLCFLHKNPIPEVAIQKVCLYI